jgi:glycosyltransferase involved in cell wall biosynthesis
MPRVSVVIPNYNHAAYIVAALDHVANQTFQDWDVIVVDDGSTDASLEILEEYQQRLTVLRSEHKGPAAARNLGIAASDSEYIAFMDADDLCESRRFELQVQKLENEKLDLVATALSFIDAQGCPLPGLWTCPPHAHRDYWASLIERNWIGTPSVILRRSILTSTGMFDEKFTHAEDYDLWLRVGRSHSIGFIEAPLIQCRRHAANTSRDTESHKYFEQEALQKLDASEACEAFARLYPAGQERDEAWIGFLLRSASPRFLDEAHRAVARNPRSSVVRFALGVFHYDSGNYERSRATFLGIPEQNAASIHNAGVTSALCGDFAFARLKLTDALRARPEYYDARYNLEALKSGNPLRLTRRPLRSDLIPIGS